MKFVDRYPDPPEHLTDWENMRTEAFWTLLDKETGREVTDNELRERSESERMKAVLASRGDDLEANRNPETDDRTGDHRRGVAYDPDELTVEVIHDMQDNGYTHLQISCETGIGKHKVAMILAGRNNHEHQGS